MYTTKKLLAALKKKVKSDTGTDSIYRIAKTLNVARPTIDKWDQGATMGDENAIKIALFLKIDPELIIASLHAERAKGSESYPYLCNLVQRVETHLAA